MYIYIYIKEDQKGIRKTKTIVCTNLKQTSTKCGVALCVM